MHEPGVTSPEAQQVGHLQRKTRRRTVNTKSKGTLNWRSSNIPMEEKKGKGIRCKQRNSFDKEVGRHLGEG